MLILLTNDDGYDSSRLKFAKETLEKFGTVIVVAPLKQQSAKSMAISIKGFRYQKIDENLYIVDGTPADCVIFAINALNLKPDIVVSGINMGYNLGFDTYYSGTVAAATQACFFGYKAMAVSGDWRGNRNIERDFEGTLNYIFNYNLLGNGYILNVNFISEEIDINRGIKITRRSKHIPRFSSHLTEDRYTQSRENKDGFYLENSDYHSVHTGYTSISKIPVLSNID